MQADRVSVDGAQLRVEDRGDGVPLVFEHAGIADSRMWERQVSALASRYRTVRYDRRGFGRSETLETLNFAPHEDLRSVIDALGLDDAVLVGSSFGGRVAIDFALTYPDRVRALVLAGTALSGASFVTADVEDAFEEIDTAEHAGEIDRLVQLELRMWVDGPTRAEGGADSTARNQMSTMMNELYRRADDPGRMTGIEPPAAGRLAELQMPILVMVGEHDIPGMHQIADRIAAQAPNARKRVLPNCAHVPPLEQPDIFNTAVCELLDNLRVSR